SKILTVDSSLAQVLPAPLLYLAVWFGEAVERCATSVRRDLHKRSFGKQHFSAARWRCREQEQLEVAKDKHHCGVNRRPGVGHYEVVVAAVRTPLIRHTGRYNSNSRLGSTDIWNSPRERSYRRLKRRLRRVSAWSDFD